MWASKSLSFSSFVVSDCSGRFGRALLDLKNRGVFHGLSFGNGVTLTHVLFVDDIILVSDGSKQPLLYLREVLNCFCKASGRVVNEDKSTILHARLEDFEILFHMMFLPFLIQT